MGQGKEAKEKKNNGAEADAKKDEKKVILLIEDEESLADMVKLRIETRRSDYEMILAYDGEAGIEAIRKSRIDLLMLDINLPKKNGIEVYKELTAGRKKPNYPVLIFTARKELEDFFDQLDVDGFISKPFDPEELLKEVERLIGGGLKPSVFIIGDDKKPVSIGMKTPFREIGYKVVYINDLETFKKMSLRHRPSYIIVDYEQKGIAGEDFVREMTTFIRKMKELKKTTEVSSILARKIWPSSHIVRIIVFSGSGESHEHECLQAGAEKYLAGVGTPDTIISYIRASEAERRAKDEQDRMMRDMNAPSKPKVSDINFFK